MISFYPLSEPPPKAPGFTLSKVEGLHYPGPSQLG